MEYLDNGLVYDTEKAQLVGSYLAGNLKLYRTNKGRWFMVPFSPISADDAKERLYRYGDRWALEKYFNERFEEA